MAYMNLQRYPVKFELDQRLIRPPRLATLVPHPSHGWFWSSIAKPFRHHLHVTGSVQLSPISVSNCAYLKIEAIFDL